MTIKRYYSTTGNNSNSGESLASAWATAAYAQLQVRELIANGLSEDVYVAGTDGRHEITSTLEFTALDSPPYPYTVTWGSVAGASAVISGGVVVGNGVDSWTLHDAPNNIWVCDYVPGGSYVEPRQLYIDGTRCYRARRASGLTGTPTATTSGFTTDDDVTNYANPTDIEFIFQFQWQNSRVQVASVVADTSVTMQQPAQTYYAAIAAFYGSRYPVAIENAYEILEANAEPGTFYWNRSTGKLYLIPTTSPYVSDPNDHEIIVPRIEQLVTLNGAARVNFAVDFQHGTWIPTDGGFADIQSMVHVDRDFGDLYLMDTWGPLLGSVIEVNDSSLINFDACTVSKLGGHGIGIFGTSDRVSVTGTVITDVSGHGVIIGSPKNQLLNKSPKRTTIQDNAIGYCGQEYQSGVTIFAPYCTSTLIDHNELGNQPYSGVGLGWGWGVTRMQMLHPNTDMTFSNNYVHDTLQALADGASVYHNGSCRNLVIEGNYFKNDNEGGIYLDQGTTRAIVRNNVIENCVKWIKLNWTHGDLTIENNHSDTPTSRWYDPDAGQTAPSQFPPDAVPYVYASPASDAIVYDPDAPTTAQVNIINNAGPRTPVKLPPPPVRLVGRTVEGLGFNGGTSSAINTTGADLLFLGISYYLNAPVSLTDSAGNTWVSLPLINSDATYLKVYYCLNPVTSATHTVTLTGSTQLSSIAFAAFKTNSVYDKSSYNYGTAVESLSSEARAPFDLSALHITVLSYYTSDETAAVDSDFIATVFPSNGTDGSIGLAIGFAWKVVTDGAEETPVWSWVGAENCATYHTIFTEVPQ